MITEIPTADEFKKAGLNLLYVAWGIAIQPVFDIDQAEVFGFDGDKEITQEYWAKVQPQLANAFSLIQQAMELALKGRIAAVSPYLLIASEPKSWPKGTDSKPVPFSEFRTLDAADLVKVHNTVAAPPLNAEFQKFFDEVRRQRNALMHTVPKKTFSPEMLFSTLLVAAEQLFNDDPWARHIIRIAEGGNYDVLGVGGDAQRNVAMLEMDLAIRNLTPAEAIRFFGFDKKRRAYLCPACRYIANSDHSDGEWPKLAQLASKKRGETKLECKLCGEATDVVRTPCGHADCSGNVIAEDECLTCFRDAQVSA